MLVVKFIFQYVSSNRRFVKKFGLKKRPKMLARVAGIQTTFFISHKFFEWFYRNNSDRMKLLKLLFEDLLEYSFVFYANYFGFLLTAAKS